LFDKISFERAVSESAVFLFAIVCCCGCVRNQQAATESNGFNSPTVSPEACQNNQRPLPSGQDVVLKPGLLHFFYDQETNTLSALVCKTRVQEFFQKAAPKFKLFHRNRGEESQESETSFPCTVVWGPSNETVEESRKRLVTSQNLNADLWKAALGFVKAQIPSTSLMIGATTLATATVGSAFFEVVSNLEAGQAAKAFQVFNQIDPSQLGWTTVSLGLFGFSRLASAMTLGKRIEVLMDLKSTYSLSQFSEIYSDAYDKTALEHHLEGVTLTDLDSDSIDLFMQTFAANLNSSLENSRIQPGVVVGALKTISSSLREVLVP
jgi:hypothetical protein